MRVFSKFLAVIAIATMVVLPAITMADDDVSTVNKSIHLDDNASAGDVDSVNGSIRIGANSVVRSVDSVNGSVTISNNVKVERNVKTVNGGIKLASGSEVEGGIETVNGRIRLLDTTVAGDIETINGSIQLLEGTEVAGNVIVSKPQGWNWNSRNKPVKVEIGEGVQVHGDLIFEHPVELKIHDSASVGEVIGDEVTVVGS